LGLMTGTPPPPCTQHDQQHRQNVASRYRFKCEKAAWTSIRRKEGKADAVAAHTSGG
jgi:hypothetical protein